MTINSLLVGLYVTRAGGSVGDFLPQSLRSNSYDHHAAIYLLLLERLRARAAGGASVVGPSASEARRPTRRPSSVADQALARELHDARREHHNRYVTNIGKGMQADDVHMLLLCIQAS